MRAWRLASTSDAAVGTVIEADIETPELTGDRVLVALQACVLGAPERAVSEDWVPGGVGVGTVVGTGGEAEHLLDQRVVFGPEQACGECDICRRAKPAQCPHGEVLGRTAHGALATSVSVRARWVCALNGDLESPALESPAAALLGREAAWAYTMFARAGVAPGEPVFVVGSDVVARLLTEIAIAKGTRPMVVHEPALTGFADWLSSVGAVSVAIGESAQSGDIRSAAEAAAQAGGHGRRPWFVFETSARPQARALTLALCGPGGRLTWLSARALGRNFERATSSTTDGIAAFDTIADMDATLLGVAGAHPDLMPELAALVVRGELDLAGAARVISLDDLNTEESRDPTRALIVTMPG